MDRITAVRPPADDPETRRWNSLRDELEQQCCKLARMQVPDPLYAAQLDKALDAAAEVLDYEQRIPAVRAGRRARERFDVRKRFAGLVAGGLVLLLAAGPGVAAFDVVSRWWLLALVQPS